MGGVGYQFPSRPIGDREVRITLVFSLDNGPVDPIYGRKEPKEYLGPTNDHSLFYGAKKGHRLGYRVNYDGSASPIVLISGKNDISSLG